MPRHYIFVISLFILCGSEFISGSSSVSKGYWIFDGSIAFDKGNKKGSDIFILNAKMNQPKKLTDVGNNIEPVWSPDGKKIAFTSLRQGHQAEIYVMDASGKNQKQVTYTKNGFSTSPRWRTDGKGIYFFSNIKGKFEENVIDLDTGKVETLHSMEKSLELGEVFQILQSPDGRYKISYYNSGKIILIDGRTGAQNDLGFGGKPAWSKDSKRLAYFMNPSPRNILAVLDVNENRLEEIMVAERDRDCYGISWNRDSKQIVYTCGPIAGPEKPWIYICDLGTKQTKKLVQGSNPDWH